MKPASAVVALALLLSPVPLRAQLPEALAAERAAFAEWLARAPTSPLAAIGATPVNADVAKIDIGSDTARVSEREGAIWVETGGERRPLARYRPVRLGKFTALITGNPGRTSIMLYGSRPAAPRLPEYYDYNPALAFIGTMTPPATPRSARVLAADGIEVDATEAGTVSLDIAGVSRLRVMRLPDPGTEESSLEVFFRDSTSGAGSYPAGRFVTLEPVGDGRYRLDFNRARNPFCAYNSVYPCPLPWPGNTIAAPVQAGERYTHH